MYFLVEYTGLNLYWAEFSTRMIIYRVKRSYALKVFVELILYCNSIWILYLYDFKKIYIKFNKFNEFKCFLEKKYKN